LELTVTPQKPMSLEEAWALLLAAADAKNFLSTANTEHVKTENALGRVLAEELQSTLNVPPTDQSAMDGYAVRCADVAQAGSVLQVSQRIAAGQVGKALAPGTAARIFTGAAIAPGADAVVMQENVEVLPGAPSPQQPATQDLRKAFPASVRFLTPTEPGQHIRRAGEDIAQGSVVLSAGTKLSPQALGLAASVGAATLKVTRRVRVALFSTGDELALPGEPLKPGAIYNSNRYTLRGLIEALGGQCTDFGIVPDQLEATRAALRDCAKHHDLIVSSGGASVGEEDHLCAAVKAEGHLNGWQLAIKPGKPLAFGDVGQALFIGLPGNPVSSWVTFLIAARPVLLCLQGVPISKVHVQPLPLRADFDWNKLGARREFLRVKRNLNGGLDLFQNQGSGVLTSTVWCDGLVDLAAGNVIQQGDMVAYWALADLLA
jgi:molybdopterin molybdotransferase